jgi:hypothetical protein
LGNAIRVEHRPRFLQQLRQSARVPLCASCRHRPLLCNARVTIGQIWRGLNRLAQPWQAWGCRRAAGAPLVASPQRWPDYVMGPDVCMADLRTLSWSCDRRCLFVRCTIQVRS